MIRQLKIVHDTAVKDRSTAMVPLKTFLVHGDDKLRVVTNSMTQIKLARHLAALRPRTFETPADMLRYSLRSLAQRWLGLDAEIKELETKITTMVARYRYRG